MIFEKLKSIPFFKFNLSVDVDRLLSEVKSNDTWVGWHPPILQKRRIDSERHKNYWQLPLSTFRPDRDINYVQETFTWIDSNGKHRYFNYPKEERKWYWTNESDNFPEIKNLLMKISDRPVMAKIVKSTGKHHIGWHNHQQDKKLGMHSPEQCITHIPLITSKNMYHLVSKLDELDPYLLKPIEDYKQSANYFVENFIPGNVYFFNSYLYHMYVNYDDSERYSIIIYHDIDENPTLENNVYESLKNYVGPTYSV